MRMRYKRVPTWRAAVLPFLYVVPVAAGLCLSACAAATVGGPPRSALYPECIDPSRGLPWWNTYPCNLINAGP